jgi:hypothetical protein
VDQEPEAAEDAVPTKEEDDSSGRVYDPIAARLNAEGGGQVASGDDDEVTAAPGD